MTRRDEPDGRRSRSGRRLLGALLVLVAAAGCTFRGPVLPEVVQRTNAERNVELAQTPFFPQTEYYCGPAALATVLNAAGAEVGLAELGSRVYLPEKRGSLQIEVMAAARQYRRMPYRIAPALTAVLGELRAGRPVLVFQNLGVKLIPVWHYAVVVGYDADADTIVLRSGETKRRVMAAGDFLDTWERADKWGVVALRPGEMPARPDPNRYLFASAAMAEVVSPTLAMEWLRAARQRWPRNAMVHFALGNALYADGRAQEAANAFRRAVMLDTDLIVARNNLAHVLAEQGCLDQARAQIERALETAPGDDAGLNETLRQTRSEINAPQGGAGSAPAAVCK